MVTIAASTLLRRPDYSGLSDSQCVAKAAALTVRRTDSELKNYRWFLQRYPTEVIDGFAAALINQGKISAHATMGAGGLDFSEEKLQDQIDALVEANAVPAQLAAQIKAVGVWHVSEWEDAGGQGQPSVEDFALARASISLQSIRSAVAARYNLAIAAIDSGQITTIDAARDFLGAPFESVGA